MDSLLSLNVAKSSSGVAVTPWSSFDIKSAHINTLSHSFDSSEPNSSEDMNTSELDFSHIRSLVRHSKIDEVRNLLEHPDWNLPIDFEDENGTTLLHIAAQNGSKRLAKLLLRCGANVNAQTHNGCSPLHFAFGFGYSNLGEYLISIGADDALVNIEGLTCYELNAG